MAKDLLRLIGSKEFEVYSTRMKTFSRVRDEINLHLRAWVQLF